MAEESDYIQEELYRNSNFVHHRNSKTKRINSTKNKNIVHIDTNEQTAIEPVNTGFVAVLSFINCQRWEFLFRPKNNSSCLPLFRNYHDHHTPQINNHLPSKCLDLSLQQSHHLHP